MGLTLIFLGGACICAGLYFVWPPSALIAAGAMFMALGVLWIRGDKQ